MPQPAAASAPWAPCSEERTGDPIHKRHGNLRAHNLLYGCPRGRNTSRKQMLLGGKGAWPRPLSLRRLLHPYQRTDSTSQRQKGQPLPQPQEAESPLLQVENLGPAGLTNTTAAQGHRHPLHRHCLRCITRSQPDPQFGNKCASSTRFPSRAHTSQSRKHTLLLTVIMRGSETITHVYVHVEPCTLFRTRIKEDATFLK